MVERGRGRNEEYQKVLGSLFKYVKAGDSSPGEITTPQVRDYVANMQQRGLAAKTVSNHVLVIKRFFLTDQIRRSSRSVCSNIAEAWRKRRYEAALGVEVSVRLPLPQSRQAATPRIDCAANTTVVEGA